MNMYCTLCLACVTPTTPRRTTIHGKMNVIGGMPRLDNCLDLQSPVKNSYCYCLQSPRLVCMGPRSAHMDTQRRHNADLLKRSTLGIFWCPMTAVRRHYHHLFPWNFGLVSVFYNYNLIPSSGIFRSLLWSFFHTTCSTQQRQSVRPHFTVRSHHLIIWMIIDTSIQVHHLESLAFAEQLWFGLPRHDLGPQADGRLLQAEGGFRQGSCCR